MRNDRRVLPVGCPLRPLPPGLAGMMAAVCAAGACCEVNCRHRGGKTGVQEVNRPLPTVPSGAGRPTATFATNILTRMWFSEFRLVYSISRLELRHEMRTLRT
jgi:hypothetical protein